MQPWNAWVQPVRVRMTPAFDLLTGLVAHWTLDEAAGATRVDSHGAEDLTDNGTMGQSAGILGNSASNDGTATRYLSRTDSAALSMGDIDFTIAGSVWADTGSNGFTQIYLAKGSSVGAPGNEYQVYTNGSTFHFSVGNGTSGTVVNSMVAPTFDSWHFLRCWHDATADVIGIVVDEGTPVTAACTHGSYDSLLAVNLGRWPTTGGGNLRGRMDSWSVWKNRVLGTAEGAALYNGGAGRDYADF